MNELPFSIEIVPVLKNIQDMNITLTRDHPFYFSSLNTYDKNTYQLVIGDGINFINVIDDKNEERRIFRVPFHADLKYVEGVKEKIIPILFMHWIQHLRNKNKEEK
jgi:hypothetical protein